MKITFFLDGGVEASTHLAPTEAARLVENVTEAWRHGRDGAVKCGSTDDTGPMHIRISAIQALHLTDP